MARHTAANNQVLRSIKTIYNGAIYKTALGIMNSHATLDYIQTHYRGTVTHEALSNLARIINPDSF